MANALTSKKMEMQIDAQETIDLWNKLKDIEKCALYSGLCMFFLLLFGVAMQSSTQEAITVNIDIFHRVGMFFIYGGLVLAVIFISSIVTYKFTCRKLDLLNDNNLSVN